MKKYKQILTSRILNYFNTVDHHIKIVYRIKRDPNFEYDKIASYSIYPETAKVIIKSRKRLPRRKFTSLNQINSIKGIGIEAMHDILYSFQVRIKPDLDKNIPNEVLNFFNSVSKPAEILKKIVDDPNISDKNNIGRRNNSRIKGKKKPVRIRSRKITEHTAALILSTRNKFKNKKFLKLDEIRKIRGLSKDTFHDILYTFWIEKEKVEEQEKVQEKENEWVEKHKKLKTRLKRDKTFVKKILTNPDDALLEAEIPHASVVRKYAPPPVTEKQAEYLMKINSAKNKKTILNIRGKIDKALESRDNKRIKKVVEWLGKGDLINANGTFSEDTKNRLSSLLQNPESFLNDLGVKLTSEEKKLLVTGFEKKQADALVQWRSNLQLDTPPKEDKAKERTFQQIKRKIHTDKALRKQWFTDPEGTFKKFNPKADNWDLAQLPDPITVEKYKAHFDEPKKNEYRHRRKRIHNSCDFKFGFSLQSLNDILATFLVFPIKKTYPENSSSPTFELEIEQLPNTEVKDKANNLLITSGEAKFTTNIAGIELTTTVEIQVCYYLNADDDKLTFIYQPDKSAVIFADNPESKISEKAKELLDSIFSLNNNTFVYQFKKPELTLPIEDQVEVIFDSIHIYDDKDTFGSGELYFEMGINDQKYLFGQYDSNSGDTISLNKRFLIEKTSQVVISARGKDRDTSDEDMGGNARIHNLNMNQYGSFSLEGKTLDLVIDDSWGVTSVATKVVCTIVNTLIDIVNKCGELIGKKNVINKTCEDIVEKTYGWIRTEFMRAFHNYTVYYRVNRIPAPAISKATDIFEFDGIEMENNALYVGFNMKSFPGISDIASKTTYKSNLQEGASLVISENLMSKAAQALLYYGPFSRIFTSKYDDITTYFSMDVLKNLNMNFDSGYIKMKMPVQGTAGTNLGPIHLAVDAPNGITLITRPYIGGISPYSNYNKGILFTTIEFIHFHGGGLTAGLLNLAAVFARIMLFWPLGVHYGSGNIPLLNFGEFSQDINGKTIDFAPKALIRKDDEIVLNVNFDIKESVPVDDSTSGSVSQKPGIPEKAKELAGVPIVANKKTKELHRHTCKWAKRIYSENRIPSIGSIDGIVASDYMKRDYDGCFYCLGKFHYK